MIFFQLLNIFSNTLVHSSPHLPLYCMNVWWWKIWNPMIKIVPCRKNLVKIAASPLLPLLAGSLAGSNHQGWERDVPPKLGIGERCIQTIVLLQVATFYWCTLTPKVECWTKTQPSLSPSSNLYGTIVDSWAAGTEGHWQLQLYQSAQGTKIPSVTIF